MENDHKDLYMLLGSNHYYIKTTIYFFFKEKNHLFILKASMYIFFQNVSYKTALL